MEMSGQRHVPGRYAPGKETRYPLYRRLDGPQGRSGQVRKISPPTGIRSQDRPTPSELPYQLRYPGPRRGFYSFGKFLHPSRAVYSNG